MPANIKTVKAKRMAAGVISPEAWIPVIYKPKMAEAIIITGPVLYAASRTNRPRPRIPVAHRIGIRSAGSFSESRLRRCGPGLLHRPGAAGVEQLRQVGRAFLLRRLHLPAYRFVEKRT